MPPGESPSPLYDVVIPTLGRPSLPGLLSALEGSLTDLPGRIWVVDDRRGPQRPLLPDGPPPALAPRVTVLPGPRRGPAAARNVGWQASEAAWVAFLDDDVVLPPDWPLQLARDLVDLVPRVAASQGRVRVPLPEGRRPTDWERNVHRLESARWITADMAVRRAALAAVGGFDERFPRPYREDADLGLRLAGAGHDLVLGQRAVEHPIRPAPWWISVRLQAGNADDVLMAALHGRAWRGADRWRTRRPRHLAVVGCAAAAALGAATGRRIVRVAGLAGWMAGTVELSWARIAPGPRDAPEVARMVATSTVLPFAATYHWLAGLVRRRRILADTSRAPRPQEVSMTPEPPGTSPVNGDASADPQPPLPHSLQVEVTAACNLRCRMCLVRYRPPVDRVRGSISLATFTRLLDEIPHAQDVTLQGLGEPLLVPDLLEMVRYASSRGMTVGFNTNATLLNQEKADALVAVGLSWLCISLDAATAETYEYIRDGSSFERVVRNIRGMATAVRRAGVGRPDLTIVFVAMRRNLEELPDVVRLAADVGVSKVSVQNLSHSFSDTDPAGRYGAIREFTADEALWAGTGRAEDVFAGARGVASALGVELDLPRLQERPQRRREGEPGCDWPWRATYVNHDGGVQPCCMVMGEDRASFGNAFEKGFQEVWTGESARRFRSALLTDEPPQVCRGCSLYKGLF